MAAFPLRGLLGLTTLIVLSTVLLSCDYASAARGGGSSRGGSSRSGSSSRSSSSSSYRSSSTSVRTKVRISTTNVRYGNRYYVFPPTVHVYGYSYYQTRHLYVTNRNHDPTVCYNDEEVDNGTAIGYFICPMADDPDSATYCCGDDDEQYCCDFWGDPGRTAGAVIGILVAIVLVIVAIVLLKKCCCPTKSTFTSRKETVTSGATCESVPLANMPPVSVPGSYPYAAPVGGGAVLIAPGYMPPPDGGLPYPPQPGTTYEGSQATGIGLPYPASGMHGQPATSSYPPTAGESQALPYPVTGQPAASYGPATTGESQVIGFEGVTQPNTGSAAPYPPYPPAAQPQLQPPPYSEAVRL